MFLICLMFVFCSELSAQTNLLDNATEDAGFEGITVTKTWPPIGTWGRSGGGSINASTTVRTQVLSDSILANPGTQPILWRSKYSYLFMYMRGSNAPTNYVWRKISGLTSGETYTFSFWYKTPAITAFTPTGHVKFGIVTDINDVQVGSIANPLNGITEFGHVEGDGVTVISSNLEHKFIKNKFTVPSGITEIYVAFVRSLDSEQLIYIDDMSLVVGDYTALEMVTAKNKLRLYPNPTKDFINLQTELNQVNRVDIIAVDGKIFKSIIPASNKIDVSGLPKSMYLIKAINNHQVESATFIKE